jgi:hypothetical protein
MVAQCFRAIVFFVLITAAFAGEFSALWRPYTGLSRTALDLCWAAGVQI